MPLVDALLLDSAPFNVWIAARNDGIQGCGTTPGDPFNGSTQARFDAVMQAIAAQFPSDANNPAKTEILQEISALEDRVNKLKEAIGQA